MVRNAREAVLISFPHGPTGFVAVTSRADTGVSVGATRWFGPIRTSAEAEVLADWLAIGGPVAPLSPALTDLSIAQPGTHRRS